MRFQGSLHLKDILWLLVPLLAGGVTYAALSHSWRSRLASVFKAQPVVDYPVRLEMGDHEIGELIVFPFVISNKGGGELLIEGIHSKCSCTGMEREKGGKFFKVKSLRVMGGSAEELVMRVSVRGVPLNSEMINTVEFHTNDPNQETCRIQAVVSHVWGGVTVTPRSVGFGRVRIGDKVRRLIDVRDTAMQPRRIEHVVSSNPDQVTARLLPESRLAETEEPHPDGVRIGQIEVVVGTAVAGHIEAQVQVFLKGEVRQPDSAPVFGTVYGPFEITPSALTLPRNSGSGSVYEGYCYVSHHSANGFTLEVNSLPEGLTVELGKDSNETTRLVRISLNPKFLAANNLAEKNVLRLKAKDAEGESILGLPILYAK